MKNNFTITVKILDSWEEDTYTLKGYKIYMIIEIAGKVYLLERYINET